MNTITSTTTQNIYHNNNTNKVNQNIYDRGIGDVSFEIKSYEDLDPYSISYSDYKNLNVEALNTIFGKGTQEWDQAMSLMSKTTITEDDTLNKIYFDKHIETKGEGEEARAYEDTLGVVAIMYGNKSFTSMDIKLLNGEVLQGGSFISNRDTSNLNTGAEKIFTTQEKLFEDFDRLKEYFYSAMQEGWTGNIDINKVFTAMDQIKETYDNSDTEKQILLEQYRKNNRLNPIKVMI